MSLHPFVEMVASLRFENTFNPYSDCCDIYDRDGAAKHRANTLSEVMTKATAVNVDAVWIGRDLGHRGGRRTGMALTDDSHVEVHARRWNVKAERQTVGAAISERTAAVVWRMLNGIERPIFLWNVFPLHPHEPNAPFTNRQHNAQERQSGEEILCVLLELLRPQRVIAVGNDAYRAVLRVASHRPVTLVRHPSYGGQRQFEQQIAELYNLRSPAELSVKESPLGHAM